MTQTNIGSCGCCGQPSCCQNLPNTLTATITTTGDCGCWATTVQLSGNGNSWFNLYSPCGFLGGLTLNCEEGIWTLYLSYQDDIPSFGAGCVFGAVNGNHPTVICSPFYLEITAGITAYLGATCCSGNVTIVITE